jgi:uncharacterized protein YbbC (DUF1343 family)
VIRIYLFLFGLIFSNVLVAQKKVNPKTSAPKRITASIQMGADQISSYLPLLKNKRVGLIVNHTSRIGRTHLVDSLLSRKVNIKTIFAPEHGFRGQASAGAHIKSGVDPRTKLPIISLYGSKKKPTKNDLINLDVLVFDIQDVGTRFYTFLSTMVYMMEACANEDKLLIILDRPNPNGFYVDGPVLKKELSSFVGVNEVPAVHGMTLGEYAQMVNGEGWLPEQKKCSLQIISLKGYTHKTRYTPPIPPSPNLNSLRAILLYPSLVYFEGTDISVGRGTKFPFQVMGHPNWKKKGFSFTPKSMQGATSPPHMNKKCFGEDLTKTSIEEFYSKPGIRWKYLKEAYTQFSVLEKTKGNIKQDSTSFFLAGNFFDLLTGDSYVRNWVKWKSEVINIKNHYSKDIERFKKTRKKYLLYPDFE